MMVDEESVAYELRSEGMPSPPFSSDDALFFPSPAQSNVSKLNDIVASTVTQMRTVKSLNPTIAAILESQKTLIFSSLQRQVNTIQSRSQAFDDGQITVFDKVLLSLTHDGFDLTNAAALEYFCREFLGFEDHRSAHDQVKFLEIEIILRELLNKACSSSSSKPSDISAEVQSRSAATDLVQQTESKVNRLMEMYHTAKLEYASACLRDNDTLIAAARFLRDTAENTIQYLKHQNVKPIIMAELRSTYEMAKEKVVELSGGRVRKFDREHNGNAVRGFFKPRRRVAESPLFHSKRLTTIGSVRGQACGRGHSGRPFGYTRPVDSYKPAHG